MSSKATVRCGAAVAATVLMASAWAETSWQAVMPVPLEWTTKPFYDKSSSVCAHDYDDKVWFCGGKDNGNSASGTCDRVQMGAAATLTKKAGPVQMKKSTVFAGFSEKVRGFFCEASAVVRSPSTDVNCFFSANDGVSNQPVCLCCKMAGSSTAMCQDMQLAGECPPLFDSCATRDEAKNRMILLGGYNGNAAFGNVLCMDLDQLTFNQQVATLGDLRADALEGISQNSKTCGYGNLALPVSDAGCAWMPGSADDAVVVVGGRSSGDFNGPSNVVQVCRRDGRDCEIVRQLRMESTLFDAKVVAVDRCVFAVFGGRRSTSDVSQLVRIGDLCERRWISAEETLPSLKFEFSLVKGAEQLCVVGGLAMNDTTHSAAVDATVACIPFYPQNRNQDGDADRLTS